MAITVDSLQIEIGASSASAASQIEKTTETLRGLKRATEQQFKNPLKNMDKADSLSKHLESVNNQIAKTTKNLETLAKEKAKYESAFSYKQSRGEDTSAESESIRRIQEDIQTYSALMDRLNGQQGDITAAIVIGKVGQEAESSAPKVSRLRKEWEKLNEQFKEAGTVKPFAGIASFAKSLGRIAFYRAIRSAIKAVTSTIAEGAENAYWYSKKYGDATKYISEAYDSLSSRSYTMGNQLGAAWATLIATIQPILLQIISLVQRAASVITQFFALLGGRTTYLKAIDYTKQWGKATKGGAAAAKEWKNQLMGFDEINRLEEPSDSGGSGGGGAGDIGSMFEEAPLEEWTNKVKEILEWCKNHMDLIKDLALGIGAAIIGWKLAHAFTNDLSKVLGLAVAIGGATVYVKGFMDAWKNGPNWKNLIEMMAGAALVAVGLGIAFGPVVAGVSLLVTGIGLLVVGFKNWIETGQLSQETFYTIEAGIAALGIGLALITGSWIPLAIAAVVALGLAIYQNWEKIKNSKIGQAIGQFFTDLKEGWGKFVDDLKNDWNTTKTNVGNAIEKIQEYWGLFKEAFELAWQKVSETGANIIQWFKDLPENIKQHFDEAVNKCKEWGENLKSVATEKIPAFTEEILTKIGELPSKMKEKGTEIVSNFWDGFKEKWDSFREWIEGKLEDLKSWWQGFSFGNLHLTLPHIQVTYTPAESAVARFFGIKNIPHLGVEWYAQGGFPEDGLFMANHGEMVGKFSNGKTAVANNEQITEGIRKAVYDAVSSAMTGNGSMSNDKDVNIYLDGRLIAKSTTKYQRQFARAGVS